MPTTFNTPKYWNEIVVKDDASKFPDTENAQTSRLQGHIMQPNILGTELGTVKTLLIWIVILTSSFTLLRRSISDIQDTTTSLNSGRWAKKLVRVHAREKFMRRKSLLMGQGVWFLGLIVSICLYQQSSACIVDSASDLTGFSCLEYNTSRSMFVLHVPLHGQTLTTIA